MKRVVAISGLPGSGSTTSAKLLSQETSLDYFTIGQVWKDISRGKAKEKYYYPELKKLCDFRGLKIPEYSSQDDSHGAASLWDTEFGKSKEFNNALDELQVRLAKKGDIIIEAKLAIHMNQGASPKIWLTASLEERSKRVAQRDGISVEEARHLLEKRSGKHESEWKKIYGKDPLEQKDEADLIIDTTDLSPGEVVNLIKEKMTNL